MDIEIKNTQKVIETCQELLNFNREVVSHTDSLQQTLNNVNKRCESNGMDKESYVVELQKQIKNLNTMEKVINDFVNSIIRYAENIEQTSQRTM